MQRLAILGLVLSFGCGKGEPARPGREVARVHGHPAHLVRSGEYLIVEINNGDTGERGRPLVTLAFVSLADGSTQPSSELVSGELAADADGAYWGDSDGQISRVDPARATITPFADVDGWVDALALDKTRLLVVVDWNGGIDNGAWLLAWVARDNGTVTPLPAPRRYRNSLTALAVTDDTVYAGVHHINATLDNVQFDGSTLEPSLEEIHVDGTTKRSAADGTILAICPYPDRLVTAHMVRDAEHKTVRYVLHVTPAAGGAPQEATLAVDQARFICGPQDLFVRHDAGIDRIDGTRLVRVVSGKVTGAVLVDGHVMYWGERDAKGWSIRSLPL